MTPRGSKRILGEIMPPWAKGDFGEIDPEGVACLYEKGRLSF